MYISLVLSALQIPFIAIYQATDFMRSLGKMYVVVAVLVCIFIGLAVMLYFMDQRLKKIEKRTLHEQNQENA